MKMKIKVNERGPKDYYDEFLYIAFRYKDFKKKPERKAYRLTSFLLVLIPITILCMILTIIMYINTKDILDIVLITLLVFIFLVSLKYFIVTKKHLNYFMNYQGEKIIDIDSDGIKYLDNQKSISVNWSNILKIIINKYSICVLPKDTNILIFIYNGYFEELLQGLKKYHKEDLIIDNRHLYHK